MSISFADLPAEYQEIKSPRFACVSLEITSKDQIIKLQQATLHVFTEKQRNPGILNYKVLRSLILLANSLQSDSDCKIFRQSKLPTLLQQQGNKFSNGSFKVCIQKLLELKLLKDSPIENPNYQNAQWTLYEFPSEQELDELISELSFSNIGGKSSSKKSRHKDTVAQNLALEDAKISRDDAELAKKHLPPAVVLIEDLMPKFLFDISPAKDGSHNKDYVKAKIDGYLVEAKGHQKISTKQAILTGLMLIRIAIGYNAKMLSQGKFKRSFEKREVPVFTNDLMLFKGSDGGDARIRTASEIYMLRDTVYDITDLEGKFSGDSKKPEFLTKDFRFIESVSSSSDEKYNDDDPDARSRSASLYIIKFSESVEKLISSPKFFTVLPESLLTENNVLVTLYLYLRSMRFKETDIGYKQLVKDLPFTGNSTQLSERLRSMLSKYSEGKKDTFDANFFGYHIKFDDDGMLIKAGTEKELTVGAGASYDPSKPKNTPTIPNRLYYLSRSSEDLQDEQISSALHNTIRMKYMSRASRDAKRYRTFVFNDEQISITAYSTDEEIEKVAVALEEATNFSYSDITEALENIRDELNIIKSGDTHINNDDINNLSHALYKSKGLSASLVDIVFHTSRYRTKKIADWKAGRYEEIIEDLSKALSN